MLLDKTDFAYACSEEHNLLEDPSVWYLKEIHLATCFEDTELKVWKD